jgi:hypothetical protein
MQRIITLLALLLATAAIGVSPAHADVAVDEQFGSATT